MIWFGSFWIFLTGFPSDEFLGCSSKVSSHVHALCFVCCTGHMFISLTGRLAWIRKWHSRSTSSQKSFTVIRIGQTSLVQMLRKPCMILGCSYFGLSTWSARVSRVWNTVCALTWLDCPTTWLMAHATCRPLGGTACRETHGCSKAPNAEYIGSYSICQQYSIAHHIAGGGSCQFSFHVRSGSHWSHPLLVGVSVRAACRVAPWCFWSFKVCSVLSLWSHQGGHFISLSIRTMFCRVVVSCSLRDLRFTQQ